MVLKSIRHKAFLGITTFALACAGELVLASSATAQEPCFERLDNGVDTTGWQRSTTNHHGPGDGWTVEDGAFVGRQTAGNLGGILMTNKTYSDVEVVLEVKIDWGCDSGIFFRTTAGDRAYQVNVDHLTGGGIGTIYGEGFTTELRARDYTLTDQGNTAVVEPGHTPIFDLSTWSTIWHPTEFNEIRARIENNPPHIQVWISNVKVMDFTDTQLRAEIDPMGPLAIQVHGGSDRWVAGGAVRFRNIRAKDLTVACVDPGGVPDAGSSESPPDASPARDAQSNPVPTVDAEPPTMNTPMDAASPPDPGQNPGAAGSGGGATEPSTPASSHKSGGGCAFVSSKPSNSASTSLPLLLLFALVGWRRRAMRRIQS